MNKKGFIKTLEAVIAIVIIFTAVIFLLPKNKISEGKVPHELENTANEILKAIQQNPDFRNAVISNNAEKVNEKIKSTLPSFTPWTYAFSICEKDDIGNCDNNYFGENFNENQISINDFDLPTKDIYTKSVFLSKSDVTGDVDVGDEENMVIRLYFWEK